jgi:tungstate transport system ATP-binding protein
MTTPLVSLRHVSQSYSGRTVLNVDSLDIVPGSIVGLAGPNGSGKSTLLRLLAFLEPPASGEVLFQGRPVSTRPGAVHRDVTLLVQEPYLLKRSVFANIAYGLKVRNKNDIPAKVHRAMELVGLAPDNFAGRQWFELSGGECQRVALAARLVLKPKMLLMDEPTASLDENSSRLVREAALFARNELGTGLVAASHDMTWLRAVSECILHMEGGRVIRREIIS